ncbi:hypothetical protein [Pollutibacter soli]|uniref:hypothetical protein n=1 Tax=Pollutibacter soli TaxID=3034157 RepID=UPI0030139005
MKQKLTKNISTQNGATEFQVRLIKNNGVGLLTTKDEQNYLILDSIDHWYDLIQEGYPKKKKCACKNEYFFVHFVYTQRESTDDIGEILVETTCTNCRKISEEMSVGIDYSPTKELVENPIRFCKKPRIRYRFKELTSYWSVNNLKDFLQFIFFGLKLNVYCWFWKHPENTRRFEKVSFEKTIQIITVNHKYLNFYFSTGEFEAAHLIDIAGENGVYLKDGIWRKNEIIQLSAPTVMLGYGLLYYINYCTQYLDKGNPKDKSDQFEKITNQLHVWLRENFITERGANCFDGKEAYEKFMAKRNSVK